MRPEGGGARGRRGKGAGDRRRGRRSGAARLAGEGRSGGPRAETGGGGESMEGHQEHRFLKYNLKYNPGGRPHRTARSTSFTLDTYPSRQPSRPARKRRAAQTLMRGQKKEARKLRAAQAPIMGLKEEARGGAGWGAADRRRGRAIRAARLAGESSGGHLHKLIAKIKFNI